MADPLPQFPHILANGPGNIPDADQVMANYQHLRGYLNERLGGLTNAQLLIADADGKVVGRTMSGGATISNTGVLSLGNGVVGTGQLADDAVTSAKVSLSTQANAQSTNLSLTGSFQDLPGCFVSLTTGVWLCMGQATVQFNPDNFGGHNRAEIQLTVGTTPLHQPAVAGVNHAAILTEISCTAVAFASISGSQAVFLRGRRSLGSQPATVLSVGGRLSAVRIG